MPQRKRYSQDFDGFSEAGNLKFILCNLDPATPLVVLIRNDLCLVRGKTKAGQAETTVYCANATRQSTKIGFNDENIILIKQKIDFKLSKGPAKVTPPLCRSRSVS